MSKIILVTGASSGFGLLAAKSLAHEGYTVFASMRETLGRNAVRVAELRQYANEHQVDLRSVELDVSEQASVDAAIASVIADAGRLDVIIHNAGHMSYGPAEAFTPEQFAKLYDTNVLSAQRVNRAALPHFRNQGQGLLVWVSSSSTAGGTPPFLAPYFAAKAAMDSLAVSYAGEVARYGIETTIVVPGAFTKGTNHFLHADAPADKEVADAYANGPYSGLADAVLSGLASLEPPEADVGAVAEAIVDVIARPHGTRPFRVHIDPSQDGGEIVNSMKDRLRAEMFRRIGLEDLLQPTS
jgi:NAD(P)-dependent dehydrogenase (short-subunit alcohol dehydrogenase family)